MLSEHFKQFLEERIELKSEMIAARTKEVRTQVKGRY